MREHYFWWLLTMACIVWYSTITVYVSVKGVADIRGMLDRLARRRDLDSADSSKEDQR